MSTASADPRIKLLFLSANPRGTTALQLGLETRQIQEKIRQARHRDALVFEHRHAARFDDLRLALLELEPHILHFSGHGEERSIIFEDDAGRPDLIAAPRLARLLELLHANLRVVVLNACDSRDHAQAIVAHIDCAIGMRAPIRDTAAIAFAADFYRNLGFGLSVKKSFDVALTALARDGDVPELFVRQGVDANQVVLVAHAPSPVLPGASDTSASGKPEPMSTPLRKLLVLVAVALGLVAVVAVLAEVGGATAPIPTTSASATAPALTPGAADIIVVAPGPAAGAGRALCTKIREVGAAPVTCAVHEAATPEQARAAHASLLVMLAPDDAATFVPLGAPWLETLLHDMKPVGISAAGSAPRIHALAGLAADRHPDLRPQDCPPLDRDDVPIDRLSLLVSLFVPACFPRTMTPGQLGRACEAGSDLTCQLARVLYADRYPGAPGAEGKLRVLLDHVPEDVGLVARIKLARAHCEARELDKATRDLQELSVALTGCRRLALIPVASCLAAASPEKLDPALSDLEAAPIADQEMCPEPQRAQLLGERARWRSRAGRWPDAANDYRAAYKLQQEEPLFALGHIEALLHEKQPKLALTHLQALPTAGLDDRSAVYSALLRWIAARNTRGTPLEAKSEARALVERYTKISSGAQVFDEDDPELGKLACSTRTAAPCPMMAVFTTPKTDGSVDDLRKLLSLP